MKKIILATIILLISAVAMKSDWGVFDGIITTANISNVTSSSAQSGGSIQLMYDDADVSQKGIVWSKTANPSNTPGGYLGRTEQGANPTSGNSLSFTSNLTDLEINTTYFVRAYMVNSDGTFYGQQISFTTIPTLGQWGAIALVSLMGIFGLWIVYRKI